MDVEFGLVIFDPPQAAGDPTNTLILPLTDALTQGPVEVIL
jgi:hypothetical protein